MRKIYTLVCVALLAIFSSSIVSASPVSKETALKVAEKILSDDDAPSTRTSGATISLAWDGLSGDAAEDELPPYYVVTRDGGGFVIIAGDDNAHPILAISEKGRFKVESMPENVKWWMDAMAYYVRTRTIPELDARDRWNELIGTRASSRITGTVTGKVERLTPEWDQGNNDSYYFGKQVFNKYCPAITSGHTTSYPPAGCVPIALAEVLTYMSGQEGVNMPTAATGTVEDYSGGDTQYKYPTFPYQLGTTYDWENLRTLTNINAVRNNLSNTALMDNLGKLIADLGAITQAAYSANGTGANVELTELAEHFGINKNAVSRDQNDYSNSIWVNLLKSEVDKRPVLYAGYDDDSSGHQFVLDGYGTYSGATVFHFNFGWGGDYNGYYYIYDITTPNGAFKYYCSAIFDFFPDPEGTQTYYHKLCFYPFTFSNVDYFGFSTTATSFSTGTPFTINCGAVLNSGSQPFDGYIDIVRSDKEGNVIEDITGWEYTGDDKLDPGYLTLANNASITLKESAGAVEFGQHLEIIYSAYLNNQENWLGINYPNDGTIVGELALMPAAFIYAKDSYSVGDYFQFVIYNYNSKYETTTWTVTSPSGTKATYSQADREFQLSQTGRYKISAALSTGNGTATENVVTYIDVK